MFVQKSQNFDKKMQMFVRKLHNFDKNKKPKMDKNTPKPKRSPNRQNRIFQSKNRYLTTQKHNLTDESIQYAVNNINIVKLFTVVAIHMQKKHKKNNNTIIIYNNIKLYKTIATTNPTILTTDTQTHNKKTEEI